MGIRIKKHQAFASFATLAIVATVTLFQNCTKEKTFSSDQLKVASTSNNNGVPYNGKLYVYGGGCSGADPVQSRIQYINANSALLTRENCAPVTPPRMLTGIEFNVDAFNGDLLYYNSRTYTAEFPMTNQGFDAADPLFKISGPWVGAGQQMLEPSQATLANGVLNVTVRANQLSGAEMQFETKPQSFGYYETSMLVSNVSGVVTSMAWWDVDIANGWNISVLSKEQGTNTGVMRISFYPTNDEALIPLPFNPLSAFHRYGALWTPGRIQFFIDGQLVHTSTNSATNATKAGMLLMHTWTGNTYSGGPPTADATSQFDYLKVYPNAKAVP